MKFDRDHHEDAKSSQSHLGEPPKRDRRSFLRVLAGSLAVAIPALHAIVTAVPASAAVAARCEQVYWVYQGHGCGRYQTTCPIGNTTNCYGVYYAYCVCDNGYCYNYVDDEGRCGG